MGSRISADAQGFSVAYQVLPSMMAEKTSGSTDPQPLALSKRRTRTIIFRVTQQEYDRLKTECDASGVRSLSEYARSELLRGDQSESVNALSSQLLSDIERKLGDLFDSTKQILEFLREHVRSF
jgi:hypothetical protein